MAGLESHLIKQIKKDGPISLARFMSEALGHPKYGYYMTKDPLGRGGDFITSPEISQMFGELVGLWLASEWQRIGEPANVRLVELGPGRGTLMVDALRAISVATPGMASAIDLHLVETSPVLIKAQKKNLKGQKTTWHSDLSSVPDGPILLIANEFFDALPIRQHELTKDGWQERMIGVKDGKLNPVLGDVVRAKDISETRAPEDASVGSVLETSPQTTAIAEELGGRLTKDGGAVLVIDYGYSKRAYGNTLQAVKGHKYTGLLDAPGKADLTAHVDFETLSVTFANAGARTFGTVDQGTWLLSIGMSLRAETLKEDASEHESNEIDLAVRRLVSPEAMGTLFKVLAVTDAKAPTPAGFAVETGHSP